MTLQEWMDRKGLKDADLAAQVKVLSRSQISRIRRGVSNPKPDAAKALAALTRIPVVKFLTGEAA